MGKELIPPPSGGTEDIALRDALEERYLAYAPVNDHASRLPDARDGLEAGSSAGSLCDEPIAP